MLLIIIYQFDLDQLKLVLLWRFLNNFNFIYSFKYIFLDQPLLLFCIKNDI